MTVLNNVLTHLLIHAAQVKQYLAPKVVKCSQLPLIYLSLVQVQLLKHNEIDDFVDLLELTAVHQRNLLSLAYFFPSRPFNFFF